MAEAEFRYSDLLPTGQDDTPYRLITTEGVSTFEANGRTFLQVDAPVRTFDHHFDVMGANVWR